MAFVALRVFETLSVLGQRGLPSRVMRLLYIEGGGVEAGLLGESGGGKSVFPSQTVYGPPNVRMSEHGNMFI